MLLNPFKKLQNPLRNLQTQASSSFLENANMSLNMYMFSYAFFVILDKYPLRDTFTLLGFKKAFTRVAFLGLYCARLLDPEAVLVHDLDSYILGLASRFHTIVF